MSITNMGITNLDLEIKEKAEALDFKKISFKSFCNHQGYSEKQMLKKFQTWGLNEEIKAVELQKKKLIDKKLTDKNKKKNMKKD